MYVYDIPLLNKIKFKTKFQIVMSVCLNLVDFLTLTFLLFNFIHSELFNNCIF